MYRWWFKARPSDHLALHDVSRVVQEAEMELVQSQIQVLVSNGCLNVFVGSSLLLGLVDNSAIVIECFEPHELISYLLMTHKRILELASNGQA